MTSAQPRRVSPVRRITALARSSAAGAVTAEVWQAVGSFALQIAAAYLLGATGLGAVSLCLGVVVMSTALTSGMVGDSLTVLDRFDRSIRSGLQWWAIVLILGGSVMCSVALVLTGVLEPSAGVAFCAASVLFQAKELLRRIAMAVMRFWRLVLVDSAAVVGTLSALWFISRSGALDVRGFLTAWVAGQALGVVAAIAVVPRNERRLVSLRRPALRAVADYGGWRGAQVAVTPTALTAARGVVVATAGAAALGAVEAARMMVAPATLAVQGLGSFLLSSYARDKSGPLAASMRRATRASILMGGAVLAVGAAVAWLTPVLAPWVTGGSFPVSMVAVFGWSVYAAAFASLQPFASLAAVRGRQRAVFAIRVADSMIGLTAVVVMLSILALPPACVPFGLAIGPFLGGVVIRMFVLRRLALAAPTTQPAAPESSGPALPVPLER